MKINNNKEIFANEVVMDGAKDVKMKILIGPDDGSGNIIMRHFIIAPGGNTPFHQHNYEHIVKIERNKGIAVDENGNEYEIKRGQSIFVKPNEKHQFRNPFRAVLEAGMAMDGRLKLIFRKTIHAGIVNHRFPTFPGFDNFCIRPVKVYLACICYQL